MKIFFSMALLMSLFLLGGCKREDDSQFIPNETLPKRLRDQAMLIEGRIVEINAVGKLKSVGGYSNPVTLDEFCEKISGSYVGGILYSIDGMVVAGGEWIDSESRRYVIFAKSTDVCSRRDVLNRLIGRDVIFIARKTSRALAFEINLSVPDFSLLEKDGVPDGWRWNLPYIQFPEIRDFLFFLF
ncbi:hypothetical protein R0381_002096 [Jeongeupia wiesaeckerbachi]|uniref:hypothetical protein n=1 Tax=Jeongeupia wiesaeckerbachi TaxID=3051218 RepID=UPI003D809751